MPDQRLRWEEEEVGRRPGEGAWHLAAQGGSHAVAFYHSVLRDLENQRLLPSFLSLSLHSENPSCSVPVQGQPLLREVSSWSTLGLISCLALLNGTYLTVQGT